tara:strand:+ start:820 stop:1293 length:474 start_codon:yes stop_codon:yes gene_type:complete
MNIQKTGKTIRLTLGVLLTSCLSVSCQTDKKANIVQAIAKGIQVESEYHYFSQEADKKIGKTNYSLRSKVEYDLNGDVLRLLVYKPEGVLEYGKEDLVNDKNVLASYGYSFKNKYTISEDGLFDSNEKVIPTKRLERNILSTKTDDKVTLYYLTLEL